MVLLCYPGLHAVWAHRIHYWPGDTISTY
jgi:serine acetyltransferase